MSPVGNQWPANVSVGADTVSVMFNNVELREVLEQRRVNAVAEAREFTDAVALTKSEDELVQQLTAKYAAFETPRLLKDNWHVEDSGSQAALILHVPFSGSASLFQGQPNSWTTSGPPAGEIVGNEVVIPMTAAARMGPSAADHANRLLAPIEQWLGFVEHDLSVWRPQFLDSVRAAVRARKSEASAHTESVAALAMPLRRRADEPQTFADPGVVRRPVPSLPDASPAEPEKALSEEYYEHILFVIRAAGKAMERAPDTYARWGEEDRRQVLVLMLNTHYEGVYAEAFNGEGKTDILIRSENKNLFIAECKFYAGPSSVTRTMDQLFSYTTWRDVKLAIVLFGQRADFSAAVSRAKDTLGEHPRFRAWLSTSVEPETEFRAQMAWPDDDARRVTLHVSMFQIPFVDDTDDSGDDAVPA